jgi:hypothetical protein
VMRGAVIACVCITKPLEALCFAFWTLEFCYHHYSSIHVSIACIRVSIASCELAAGSCCNLAQEGE